MNNLIIVVYLFIHLSVIYTVIIAAISYESGFWSQLGNTPVAPRPHNPKLLTAARLPFQFTVLLPDHVVLAQVAVPIGLRVSRPTS